MSSSSTGLITLVFVGLLVLKATSREVGASPAPAVDSVSPAKYSAQHSVEPKSELDSGQLVQERQIQPNALVDKQQPQQSPPLALKPNREVSGEKLRRGLSNFLNHLNPAQFFVPAAPLQPGAKKPNPAGSQAEPAAIINVDGPTANALIKGPSRLAAPLRWGRK